MDVTVRQTRRILTRDRALGGAGLISKQRGRASNRRLPDATAPLAMHRVREHDRDVGPTVVCEKLRERHSRQRSIERTRQLMMADGDGPARKGANIRIHPMRPRRARLGELIQIDGSPHPWCEERGAPCTLLVFIDDATGTRMPLRVTPTEPTRGYRHTLHDHLAAHGVPVARYRDHHSLVRLNAKDAAPEAETQFSRAARELGIACIHAHSPQAQGRVERAHQTLQDRLVKDMRLAGLSDMDSANAWLPRFMADYNRRVAVVPKDPHDAQLPDLGTAEDLTRILSVQGVRTLSKNLSCPHQGRLLHVEPNGIGWGCGGLMGPCSNTLTASRHDAGASAASRLRS